MSKSLQKQIDELDHDEKIEMVTYMVSSLLECNDKEEPKEWPQNGDTVYFDDGAGIIMNREWGTGYAREGLLKRKGNYFKTKEACKMYALRIESLSKGFIPNTGEVFWWWDSTQKRAKSYNGIMCMFCLKFKTEEECQAWYDTYGKAWEYLYK